MENNLINGALSLFDKNVVNSYKDLHRIKMEAINTLMQNYMNDPEVDYESKWAEIHKLEQIQKSKNLFTIIKEAFKNNNISLKNLNSDWYLDFCNKAQNISNDEFQRTWSNILSAEAEEPGKIPKKLLHQLYLMDSNDAKNFIKLSQFCFADKEYKDLYHPIIPIRENYRDCAALGITYEIIEELEQLNLIKVDYNNEFTFHYKKYFYYKDKYIEITNHNKPHLISAGNVQLTSIGKILLNLINPTHNDAVFKYIVERWLQDDCIVQVNNKFLKL